MVSDREVQAMADRQAALNGVERYMSEYAVKSRNPSMYDNGGTVTSISAVEATDKQKAQDLDRIIRGMEDDKMSSLATEKGLNRGRQEGVDIGLEEGQNRILNQIRARQQNIV
jgi:hypothetical protein|tara:strand:- start:55 stop:393 length:339 start_codon:yes stop_codon:yes gene_type:complete